MTPLYLVDGSGYIFRAFYAIAPLTNSKGLPTNALYGFTRMVVKLLRDVHAEHVGRCLRYRTTDLSPRDVRPV